MARQIKTNLFFVLIIGLAQLLSSCGRDDYKDLKNYIEDLKKHEVGTVTKTPLLPLQSPTPAVYHHSNRTPFEAPVTVNAKKGANADPLQAYPLTMLRLVGTVSKDDRVFAFIVTPDNMIYQVSKGDVIGDQDGKIIDIQLDRVNVMELDKQNGKEAVQRLVTLQLKDEKP